MSLLNVTNVSHGFGERVILKNYSFFRTIILKRDIIVL